MARSFLAAAFVLLAACTSVPPVKHTVTAGVEQAAHQAVDNLFPTRGTLVHKVRVDVGRRDLVLTGYLLLDREKGFQAVAVDEFGGKIFEFGSCLGKSEIRLTPAGIDHGLLLRGPVQDLILLYLEPEELRVRRSIGGEILVSWVDDDMTMLCRAGRDGRRIEGCEETRGRHRIRSVSFLYDEGSLIPSTITIVNDKLHYTMTAELLKLDRGLKREVCP